MIQLLIGLYQGLWLLAMAAGVPILLFMKRPWLFKRWLWSPGRGRPNTQDCIWIHALSLGELFSVWALPEALKKSFPNHPIVLTTSTEKAFRYLLENPHPFLSNVYYMPLDFLPSIKRFYRALGPKIGIIVETDLWPCMLWYMKRKGIPILLINGRLSPRSFRKYKKFAPILRHLLLPITKWLMQSTYDSKRLMLTGAVPLGKILTTGNLKFDSDWGTVVDRGIRWSRRLGIKENDHVLVAGSTHEGEEEILLRAIAQIRSTHPNSRLIIVPRDIDRADKLLEMANSKGLKSIKRSGLDRSREEPWEVLVIDTVGELREIYGVGEIAFVGGSLVPIGGHNLLEPARHGIPVLFGPYTHNFVEISALLLEGGGGKLIRHAEDLIGAWHWVIRQPWEAEEMGKKARELAFSHSGAKERTIEVIEKIMAHDGKIS